MSKRLGWTIAGLAFTELLAPLSAGASDLPKLIPVLELRDATMADNTARAFDALVYFDRLTPLPPPKL